MAQMDESCFPRMIRAKPNLVKCRQCRSSHVKCEPSRRSWPGQRCDACTRRGLPCSAPTRKNGISGRGSNVIFDQTNPRQRSAPGFSSAGNLDSPLSVPMAEIRSSQGFYDQTRPSLPPEADAMLSSSTDKNTDSSKARPDYLESQIKSTWDAIADHLDDEDIGNLDPVYGEYLASIKDAEMSASLKSLLLESAATRGCLETCTILLRRQASPYFEDRTLLHAVAPEGISRGLLSDEETQLRLAVLALHQGVPVDSMSKKRQTTLHLAAESDAEPLVRLLISYGADTILMDSEGNTPLVLAIRCHAYMSARALIKAGAEVDLVKKRALEFRDDSFSFASPLLALASTTNDNEAQFHQACEILTLLLDAGANIDANDPASGLSPLSIAASRDIRLFSVLHEKGACVFAKDHGGNSILDHIFEHNSIRALEHLLRTDSGVKTDLLHKWAVYHINNGAAADESLLEVLLKHIPTISDPILGAEDALNTAAGHGWVQAVQLLLNAGVPGDDHYRGMTPSIRAADNGHVDVLEVLIAAGCDLTKTSEIHHGQSSIHRAAARGHTKVVARILKHCHTMHAVVDSMHFTPLQTALRAGQRATAAILDQHEFGVWHLGQNASVTPELWVTISAMNAKQVETLSFAQSVQWLFPALHLACGLDREEIWITLDNVLENKLMRVLPGITRRDLTRDLAIAARWNCRGVMNATLAKIGGVLSCESPWDDLHEAFGIALRHGYVELADSILCAAPSLINIKVTYGSRSVRAFDVAANNADLRMLEMLLRFAKSSQVSARPNSGASIDLIASILGAAALGHQKIVSRLLVEQPSLIDARDERARTALFGAILGGHTALSEFLVGSGADVNLADDLGNFPLLLACDGGHEDIVRLLLVNGADPFQEGREGETALKNALMKASWCPKILFEIDKALASREARGIPLRAEGPRISAGL